ncbi:MAG: PspA/IM30 family protein [Synergistaceae bacterium]|jgi:phage shock protein A|uniref:Phage shock protein A (PspA) family protein n=1 Tax=Aminivibrio pyruvatiphilus TaxID=1005740 RepID=A0A4R8LYY7_9BACT|nr:PspA/IM30 family protein [Aminivibrio pyruvatiphilus]MDD2453797.1 PspA/IM30 family protein [Synergistaceae bacterium]NCC57402.1 PspA/IM30 family protein [Synergistales bacterium]MDD3390490.1 PspA/IM30 family protein [Synergistaceae bacterium]MDD3689119.1 PspA/IM30 family protein [Synergistaceae bacterium]MDD4022250.1 PspA/IM30 family protein [Synergistaceae bacterium]
MSIFNRMADIFKSNVNEALDRMEDPEKMVKQMIIEMEEGLVKATSGLAKAMANEKNLQKQQAVAANQARQWEEKATMALKGGNTDLAKQALSKKVVYDGQVQQYQAMVTQASNTTSQLRMQLDTLKGKLDEARMKQSTLVARSQTAKTQKEFSTILGTNVGQGAFAKFDKMEKKIEGMEAEAEAFSELSGEGPADDPFKSMEKDMQVDDEMAKLLEKMNLGGGANA